MEDIIYEQDYTKYKKTEQDRRAQAIFDQAVKGGFFHTSGNPALRSFSPFWSLTARKK